jgi:hypothetical protein
VADQGELAKREQVRNFRKWIGDNLPADQARRAWQLLESLVFISNPNLAGTRFYETRTKATAPTSADYPNDGFGLWIDTSAGEASVVVQWQGTFYIIGGVGGSSGPVTADYDDISANDAATDVSGAELEELTDASETTLHSHAAVPTTADYGDISANDAATDVSGAELEELTDASETTLHSHAEVPTTADYGDISANDAATDVSGAELEELTDGSATSLHTHDDDCPEYKYIKALAQPEGDIHLSDVTNWNTSLALIKSITIRTLSTDWDGWILRNDNGYVLNDANIPSTQIMDAGSGNYVIEFDLPYEDEDASGEVHLHLIDNLGSNTFDVELLGYGLK